MAYGSSSERNVDELLDQAVADSFPASDPVSLAMPHRRERTSSFAATDLSTALLVTGGVLAVIALLALRR
jgi:hypothetical protein